MAYMILKGSAPWVLGGLWPLTAGGFRVHVYADSPCFVASGASGQPCSNFVALMVKEAGQAGYLRHLGKRRGGFKNTMESWEY